MLSEANALERVIDKKISKATNRRTRTTGIVNRIDTDGTIYVLFDGADSDTIISKSTASVREGDFVSVRVENGQAIIEGNTSDPSASSAQLVMTRDKAFTAFDEAIRASNAANAAEADAARAHEAADSAQASATTANVAANDALVQLGTVEDVIGTATWIAEHGTYEPTTDTAVDDSKVYYERSGAGTQADPWIYTAVAEPTGNPQAQGYYELHVDAALSQYVASHLALTDAGLYVLRDASGYKLLCSNTGVSVIDPQGHVVATYGESITFDSSRSQHIGNEDAYILFTPANGSTPARIVIGGSNVQLGSSKTLSEWEADMQQAVNDAANAAQSAIDGLEVGGRNFAVEGSLAVGYFDAAGSAFSLHAETSNRERATDYIPVVEGEPVTIQVWIDDTEGWSSFQPWIGFYFYNAEKSSAVGSRRTQTGATGDTYASVTTDVPTGASFLRVSFRYYNGTRVKVERGNVPTDWTPAPEDVRAEAFVLSQPNLTPFFSIGVSDGAYWFTTTNMKTYGTALADGWVRFSAFSLNMNISPKIGAVTSVIKPSTYYTVMLEVRNSTVAAPVRLQLYTANNSMWAATKYVEVTGDGTYYVGTTTKADLTASAITHLRIFLQADVTANVSSFAGDVRFSIYEGDYHGPYKPYVGTLLYGLASDSVEYIIGTQTATTGSWTGVTRDSALADGKVISYKLTHAGSGNATLNLTLADGTTTGAKPVYHMFNTGSNTSTIQQVNTQYPAGSVILMTYDATAGRWIVSNYNTNVNQVDRTVHSNTLKSASANATGKSYAVSASSIIGYVDALGGYQTITAGTVVDLTYPMLWATGNLAASKTFTNAYEVYPSCTLRTNLADWTGTTYDTAYLVGTVVGKSFTVDQAVFASGPATTEDGLVYIPVGQLYSAYQVAFRSPSVLYAYKDGKFQELSLGEASLASKTATSYIVDYGSGSTSGIWITPEDRKANPPDHATAPNEPNADTRGWRIGDALELFRGTLSMLKAWVDSNLVAHLRVGVETAGHAVFSPDGMEVFDGGTSVAAFGSTARVGALSQKHIDLTTDGIEFHDGAAAIGTFGQKSARSYPKSWAVDYDTSLWQDGVANAISFRNMVSSAGTNGVLTGTGGVIGGYVLNVSEGKWDQIGIRQDTMRAALTAAGYDADEVFYNNVDSASWNLQASNVTSQSRSVLVRSSLNSSTQYDICEFAPDFFREVDSSEKGLEVDANFDAYDIGCRDVYARDVKLAGGIQDMSGNPLIQAVEATSTSATNIAAGSYGSCTATLPVPNGYEVIGITGIKTNNQNMLDVNSWSTSGNVVTAYLHNFSTASQAAKITVYATCINSQLAV